jgi:hypothetical protein
MRQLPSSHLTRVISCTEAPIFAIEIGTDMRSLLQFLNLGVLREWLGVCVFSMSTSALHTRTVPTEENGRFWDYGRITLIPDITHFR